MNFSDFFTAAELPLWALLPVTAIATCASWAARGNQMTEIDEKLTPRDAARHVGIAVSTLAKLRCCGGSPRFYKLGSKVAYSRSDLDAWLAARCVHNTIEGERLPRRLTDEPRAA